MKGGAQQKVRDFYRSCMAESRVPRLQTLKDFRSLISNATVGGTEGAVHGEGSRETSGPWDLRGTILKIHQLNTWPLFQVLIGPDERNPEVNIIKVPESQFN